MIIVSRLSDDEDIWFLEGAQFDNGTPFVEVCDAPSDVYMHDMQSGGRWEGWRCPIELVCRGGVGDTPRARPLRVFYFVTKRWIVKMQL